MEQNTTANLARKPSLPHDIPLDKGGTNLPSVRQIRTMQNDIGEAIAIQNETATSIALAEAKKREQQRMMVLAAKQALAETANLAPKPRGRGLIFFIFFILLVLTGALIYKVVAPKPLLISLPLLGDVNFGKPIPDKIVSIAPVENVIILAPALIQPQSEKRFDLNKENPEHVAAIIGVERTAGLSVGEIKNLYFFKAGTTETKVVTSQELLSYMRVQMTAGLIRTLEPQFMVGLIGDEGSIATPFVALKVSDVDIARSELLAWEPSLAKSFDAIFGTKIEASLPPGAKFHDELIGGRDTRVLTSASGLVVAYSFTGGRTIYITSSRTALTKLLSRIATKY